MKAAIIAVGIVVALTIPAHAIECQLSKGASGYHWAWREIDGRRCWYEGERGMAKSKLHWPAPPHAAEPRSTEPASKPQLPSPSSADLAPPPTEPSPPDQTTLSYWKRNDDGSLIETGTSIHVFQTDPPSIPRVITFDGTPLAMPAPSPSANASFRRTTLNGLRFALGSVASTPPQPRPLRGHGSPLNLPPAMKIESFPGDHERGKP